MNNSKEAKIEVMISAETIAKKVAEMAAQISADYKDKNPLVVGVLKGAWMFHSDLVRALSCDCEIDFVAASSYGNGTVSSGEVNVLKDLTLDCTGRHVLLVEDIIDTGVTLSYLKELLHNRNTASVAIATLLSKPSRRKVEVDVAYCGFEIPDEFVIGYGMDYAEKYRNLPEVCILRK